MDIGTQLDLVLTATILMLGIAGVYFLLSWQKGRGWDQQLRSRQLDLEAERLRTEVNARERERHDREMQDHERSRREETEAIRHSAGAGTGGFIVVDLAEDQRPLFRDLLSGFEEFARLKGYLIAFSVDATFPNRIAFKFTLREDGISVGPQRVREDFREYVAKVQSGDDLGDMPVVISLDEHELLVAALRNRLSFIQHTYRLRQNALAFYVPPQRLRGSTRVGASPRKMAAPLPPVSRDRTCSPRSTTRNAPVRPSQLPQRLRRRGANGELDGFEDVQRG